MKTLTSMLKSLTLAFLFLLLMLSFSRAESQPKLTLSTPEQIKEDFSSIPCKNEERISAAELLFKKMGAAASEMSIEKHKGVENLIVKHSGTSPEVIVIGAHYDKADVGCGAVDNWSGIVAMAHIYRAVRQFGTNKNVLFVAFGKEEKGLVGSRAMVNAITKEQASQYCAMINIDSFGLATPFVLENISTKKLVTLADEIANEMKIPFAKVRIAGPTSDSSSFIAKKIPSATLSGLSNELMSVIHTKSDQVEKVNMVSVYLGYRLALGMWSRIESAECGAFK